VLDDVASFHSPVGADRGGGEICHTQVGGVVVQRGAVLAEQPAELGERLEVTAVGETRDAEGTPGPGDTLAADLHVLLSRLNLREVVLAGFAMVPT
jgi:hypothetical protein